MQRFFYINVILYPSLQCRISTYLWLLLGYPVLVVVHCLACVLSWLPVFTIPVAKMNARMMTKVLLMAPEDIQIHTLEKVHAHFLKCEFFLFFFFKTIDEQRNDCWSSFTITEFVVCLREALFN